MIMTARQLAGLVLIATTLAAVRPAASADLQVEVLATAQSTFNATGIAEVSLTALARSATGDMFAFDTLSNSIVKITAAGAVTPFVSEQAILAVTGAPSVDIRGLAIGSGGDLFAADQGGLNHGVGILRIPASGGAVTVFASGDAIAAAGSSAGSHPDEGTRQHC